MRPAALALTLALAPIPTPADRPGLPARVVEHVTDAVDDLIGPVPSATPAEPVVSPPESVAPAPAQPPGPARQATTPESVAPSPVADRVPAVRLGDAPTASPSLSAGAVTPEATDGVVWASPADVRPAAGTDGRVFVVAALVVPFGVWVWRRTRRPRPVVLSAAQWEEAYELGRLDEQARSRGDLGEAARVLPFRRRDSEKPPAS